ncbi:myeloid cell nuclear differentiation antigen [Talpa occidentalis]|uniref:myeloid cell nuclear differentiation antigen n=1 Tax=Talpa occidentalis TaxID=50954 RepID=UPI00188FEF2F|nr:myeloid cell nuclear differentiation antigen [Talpa occidentalis]XP_054549522.1 myeloid cell nuclear differentiation antigen [Talpa occidentalis]
MGDEYKRIILVDGLHNISDDHFEMIKSLLKKDLNLTSKMQQEYNRVKIADVMEAKFPGAVGVEKLIKVFKSIPELKDHAKELLKKKQNVANKIRKIGKTPEKKKKPEKADPAIPANPAKDSLTSGGPNATTEAQKRGNTTQEMTGTKKSKMSVEQTQLPHLAGASVFTTTDFSPPTQSSASASSSTSSAEKRPAQCKAAAKRGVLQKGPMMVKVLKASEPFEYECPEKGKDMMFHATVANEKQFFQVKVLNINLKEKFTKDKVITLSDYFECKGILEVNKESFVLEADSGHQIEVPLSIKKRANETPKIDNLLKQASGTFVYGLFEIHNKKVNKKNTIYEIQDSTAKMDVVGSGKWHNIDCKEGDKFRLFYFKLRTIDQKPSLMCENHSFLQVIKAKKKKENPSSSAVNQNFQPTSPPPSQLGSLTSYTVKVEPYTCYSFFENYPKY